MSNPITRIECRHGQYVYLWFADGAEERRRFNYWREARRNAWKLACEHGLSPLHVIGGVVQLWTK